MTVAVVRGRDTLLLKGYGSADVELGVPTPDDAIYEVGSITKQFTAAAILQLADAGKLSLDDDIRTYVPGFRSHGYRITLRELLNHTAGVFDYVSLNGYLRLSRVAVPRDSVVTLFGDHPLDFVPGTAMAYSNSGYFLLGMVIERVAGEPFDAYVTEHLLKRADMRSASFCSTSRVVPHRAHGYDVGEAGLRLPYYVDFTWVYSVGSLCMSARDLIAWTLALHGGRILHPAAYREMVTPDTLSNGVRLRYADGLATDSILGHRALHHGGDLPGFASEVTYLPDDSLAVVMLMNTEGPVRPDELTASILHLLVQDRSPIRRPVRNPLDYVGEYTETVQDRGQAVTRTVRILPDRTDGGLAFQIDSGPARPVTYIGHDQFERGDTRFTFIRASHRSNAPVIALDVDGVYSSTPARLRARQPPPQR